MLHTEGDDVVERARSNNSDTSSANRARLESINSEGTELVSESMMKDGTADEEEEFHCPIGLLPGEDVLYQGQTVQGHLVLITQFRLFISGDKSFAIVPLRMIECVDCVDVAGLSILCKDGTSYKFYMANSDKSYKWLNAIKKETTSLQTFSDHFAVRFASSLEDAKDEWTSNEKGYSLEKEINRLRFKKSWKISTINEKLQVTDVIYICCNSYPQENLVPRDVDNECLERVARFRTLHRFPSAVWRHVDSGAVLLRSSQPNIGVFCQRCEDDEKFMQSVINACGSEERDLDFKPMLIADARSFAAAYANRYKGGGCEYEDYYTKCDIMFMGLPNIHAIRSSLNQLRLLMSNHLPDTSWYSSLESTKWMVNLSLLLEASRKVAESLTQRPVLVHCSDGWDRTSQIVSLAQLILDPYYRTFKGFQVLVEKDWLLFGHKFADRCGHVVGGSDPNELSPVFVQWLDAVYQLITQNPTAFEFNSTYLLKLKQHVYSCLFGTFLFNSEKERSKDNGCEETMSVWISLNSSKSQLRNRLFTAGACKTLLVSPNLCDLVVWMKAYASYIEPPIYQDSTQHLSRCHSYADITSSGESDTPTFKGPRRSSDHDLMSSLNNGDTDIINGKNLVHLQSNTSLNNNSGILSGSPCLSDGSYLNLEAESIKDPSGKMHNTSRDQDNYLLEAAECKKYIDKDGLILPVDPVQKKIDEISAEYERKMNYLKKKIQELEKRSLHPPCKHSAQAQERRYNSLSSYEADEPGSAGSSSDQSDSSWEEVSKKDTGLTLWLPDHAATTCTGCHVPFQIYRRKHHCRQCGLIFCQNCASNFRSLPGQQLFEPVRVCQTCLKGLDEYNVQGNNTPQHNIQNGSIPCESVSTPSLDSMKEQRSCTKDSRVIQSTPVPIVKERTLSDVSAAQKGEHSPRRGGTEAALNSELSVSQQSLTGSSSSLLCQKTCSQESINSENTGSIDNKINMITARAEC